MADMNVSVLLRLVDRLSGPARRVHGAMDRIKRSTAGAAAGFARLQAAAMAAGAAMMSFGGAMIGRGMTAAFGLGAGIFGLTRNLLAFDEQMNRAAAVSSATPAQFERMKVAAERMGRTTRFTATQAADALSFLNMAGLGVEKSIGALPHTLNLAAATGADLGQAADISTNILTGFGKAVHELPRVNDILAKTTATSNLNIMELSESMKKAAPVSNMFGVSLAETSAILGMLANQGIKGGIAGRGLARVMQGTVKQTAKAGKAWEALGLNIADFTDEQDRITDFAGMVGALQEAGATMRQLQPMFDTFGARTIGALLNVPDIAEKLRAYTKRVQDAGFASEAAATRMQGLPGAWLRLKSAMQGVILSIGNAGARSDLIATFDRIREGIKSLYSEEIEAGTGKLITRLKEGYAWWFKWGTRIAMVAAALAVVGILVGVLSFAFGALLPLVTGLAIALGWLGTALLAAMGPAAAAALGGFLGLLAGIAFWAVMIGGAAYLIYRNWEGIATFFSGLWSEVIAGMQAFLDWLRQGFGNLGAQLVASVGNIGGQLRAALGEGLWSGLANVVRAGWGSLIEVFEWAAGVIRGIVDGIASAIGRIGSAISGATSSAKSAAGNAGARPVSPGTVLQGRATGGPVAAGVPYIVGERGPEVFVPKLTGKIVPNHGLRRAAAGLALGAAAPLIAAGAQPTSAAPAQPQITAHITINVTGRADGEEIARKVTAALNDVARSALHDGAYDA